MGTRRGRPTPPPAASPLPFDLGQLNASHDLELSVSRAEHPDDARLRRIKDYVLFSVAILFLVAVGGYCLYVIATRAGSTDEIKWANTILYSVLAGLVGYATGKTQR